MNQTNGSLEPTKSTQISSAMDHLEKAIESNGTQANCLTARIESVLRQNTPKTACSEDKKGPDQVQLAARLSTLIVRLNNITENIAETEKRVEL